ncbi:MAG: bifunctional DNA-formamidopyrimidine glycosylase/DNA-(apurinic or apyrimidinic site) lyase [Candidatus Rickettsia vulgarisii]
MPELPEIETLKNCLESKLINLNINKLEKTRDNIRYQLDDKLGYNIRFAKITSLRRRAKYLLIDLDNSYSIIVHLGMTGRLTIQPNDYLTQKHDHIIIYLDNNQKLVFNDHRRFGMIYAIPTESIENKFFGNLGMEPLSKTISTDYLKVKLQNRKVPIKNLIMDNQIIVGVGNIYACESLFMAKIDPKKLGSSLQDNEITTLLYSIQKVLTKAILAGGTTVKDFVSGDSKPGYFQQELQVYGREDQPCSSCSGVISRIKQSGRATFYCSSCQS